MADVYSLTIRADTRDVTRASGDLGVLSAKAANASRENQKLASTSQQVAKASKFSANGLRGVSLQLSQVAQQGAATGNFLQALAIQLPDLALGFGPLGIAIGAAAGGLASFFLSSSDAAGGADQLGDSIEYLDRIMGRTDDSVFALTKRIRELAKESKAAAEVEIQRGIVEAASAFNTARERLAESAEDVFDTTILGDFDAAVSQAERLARLGMDVGESFERFTTAGAQFREGINLIRDEAENLNSEFGISIEASRDLIGALGAVQADPTAEGFRRLQRSLFDATQSSEAVSPAFVRTASELSNLASKAVEAAKRGETLREWATDIGEALRSSNPDIIETQENIQKLTDALESEYLQLSLSGELLLQHKLNVLEVDEATRLRLSGLYEEIQALKDKKEAEEDARKALMASTKIGVEDDPMLQRIEAEERGNEIIKELRAERIEEEKEMERERLDFLLSANDAAKMSITESARFAIDNVKGFSQRQQEIIGATASTFGALKNIAKAGGEESFQAYKRLAQTEAAIAGALAFTKALASAPPPFNFALAGAVAASTAVQIATIENQEYSGARQMGGSVTGGKSYLVGENGPEVVTMGGSGVVTPSSVNGGSESGNDVIVNVNNAPPGTRTEERRDSQGKRVVDVFISDLATGGPMSKSIQNTFGVRRQGR